MERYKIAIIGAGNMGLAIARGLAGKGYDLAVSNPHRGKLDAVKAACPEAVVTTSNSEVAKDADLIILAVKPAVVPEVLAELCHMINPVTTAIASLAAPITLADLRGMVTPVPQDVEPRLLRVIPNTAISVGRGMTFIAASGIAGDELERVVEVFGAMGQADVIDERLMPAATALCSCGLAFAMRYVRAAVMGAVELGLEPADALRYEVSTLEGACALLSTAGVHPEAEIDHVTTPGGITIRGLNAMERYGLTTAVIEGLKASCPGSK